MSTGRGKAKGRREPRFDAFPVPGLGLRLSARDRFGGPPPAEKERARRAPAPRREAKPASEERPRERPRAQAEKVVEKPARRRSGGGRGRSFLGRLVYWG